jgi:peptidase E
MIVPFAPKSVYLLAGGPGSRRTSRDPMLAHIVASTGVIQPRVAYVGAASGDNRAFFLLMSTLLSVAGSGAVKLASMVSKRANLDKTRQILTQADLIFISGGDVEEGMHVLHQREMLSTLIQLYQAGKPFFGISAGSIMLAREWVRWQDPNDDATSELFPCMGLANLLCDTHGEGDHWEELQMAVKLSPPGTLGYGIRAGAGLCLHPDSTLEVIGGIVDTFRNDNGLVKADVSLSQVNP